MERKAASGTMLTLLFLSMLTLAFFSAVEASEYGGYEVKFRGIAISDEKWGEIVAYGSYYCEVTVLGILYDPNSTLSLNDNVTIAYQDSLSLHIGDEVECYGTNCINCTTCPKQNYGYIVCKPTPYYVIRYPHKLLLETDKPIYKLGENVTITLTNISNETIEIGGYPAWQIFTYPEEDPVYPRIFAFLAWSLDLGENDTFTWNQYDEFTQCPATPGKYVVKDTQGWGLSAFFDIVPAEDWVPYVPLPNMVDLVFWTKNRAAYINVTITFPDAGYKVSDWGTVVKDGCEIWVDSEIWDWTGPAVLVITKYCHTYDLGRLKEGDYVFTFKAWGFPVKSISFSIPPTVAGDVNNDGTVNMGDLSVVSAHWYPGPPIGPLGYDADADLNNDGTVNMIEVAIISANWGQTVP